MASPHFPSIFTLDMGDDEEGGEPPGEGGETSGKYSSYTMGEIIWLSLFL